MTDRLGPYWQQGLTTLYAGDCRAVMRQMELESVQVVCCSPPYFGLRSYGTEPQIWGGDPLCQHEWLSSVPRIVGRNDCGRDIGGRGGNYQAAGPRLAEVREGAFCSRCGAWRGELGSEPTVGAYVEHLVEVFREVRRVLRQDGTLWLNLGDSYCSNPSTSAIPRAEQGNGTGVFRIPGEDHVQARRQQPNRATPLRAGGLKQKDLLMVPARVALALQADGWWIRSEITGCKVAPMPESVTDRPTSATEKVYLLTKRVTYYYDATGVREPYAPSSLERVKHPFTGGGKGGANGSGRNWVIGEFDGGSSTVTLNTAGRNLRNWFLWTSDPFPGAHFATYPERIPEIAILAGSSARGACAQCGAPWKRVVERVSTGRSKAVGKSEIKRSVGLATAFSGYDDGSHAPVFQTLGWSPTCQCEDAGEPVPCLILDPFAGSGTTLAVAQRLGRRAVGIDLNPDYVNLAIERNRQQGMVLGV